MLYEIVMFEGVLSTVTRRKTCLYRVKIRCCLQYPIPDSTIYQKQPDVYKMKTRKLTYLAPAASHSHVRFDVFFADLIGHFQSHRAVFIIDRPLCLVTQHRVGVVDILELQLQAASFSIAICPA